MNWIVVLVIIVIAVVSAIAQTVKNQQEKEQQQPRRRPNTRPNASGVKTGSSDMDRFLQEIEKLRKRAADGGEEPKKTTPRNKSNRSIPTVTPKRNKPVPTVAPSRRIDDLPTATVVPPPPPAPPASYDDYSDALSTIARSAPQLTDHPTTSVTPRYVPTTEFGQKLQGMLSDKQSLPMAIILQEILGPPKSRKV